MPSSHNKNRKWRIECTVVVVVVTDEEEEEEEEILAEQSREGVRELSR